ncbi:MAG: hypothetical protein E7537_02945 [Ruminococcaceae bacterium]|nr:hypothetical protein [Oscillospiraceae bacterium]
MDTLKLFAIILISAFFCVLLKQYKPEFSVIIAFFCSAIILTAVFEKILSPITLLEQKLKQSGIDNNYFKVALKALGIGYITTFIADSCRDQGQTALAFKAELVGKCAIFILSIPLVLSILETALGFIK